MFHLHASTADGSALDDISLCVVDTNHFNLDVFLRDVHLIREFRDYDPNLRDFEELRLKRSGGRFYFGEFLSQGALKIEGHCQTVTAQALIERGLYDLQPKFREFAQWRKEPSPPWANAVLELRSEFSDPLAKLREVSLTEQRAAMNIAQLFPGHWKLNVAANLFGLLPRQNRDKRILEAFGAFTRLSPNPIFMRSHSPTNRYVVIQVIKDGGNFSLL